MFRDLITAVACEEWREDVLQRARQEHGWLVRKLEGEVKEAKRGGGDGDAQDQEVQLTLDRVDHRRDHRPLHEASHLAECHTLPSKVGALAGTAEREVHKFHHRGDHLRKGERHGTHARGGHPPCQRDSHEGRGNIKFGKFAEAQVNRHAHSADGRHGEEHLPTSHQPQYGRQAWQSGRREMALKRWQQADRARGCNGAQHQEGGSPPEHASGGVVIVGGANAWHHQRSTARAKQRRYSHNSNRHGERTHLLFSEIPTNDHLRHQCR